MFSFSMIINKENVENFTTNPSYKPIKNIYATKCILWLCRKNYPIISYNVLSYYMLV